MVKYKHKESINVVGNTKGRDIMFNFIDYAIQNLSQLITYWLVYRLYIYLLEHIIITGLIIILAIIWITKIKVEEQDMEMKQGVWEAVKVIGFILLIPLIIGIVVILISYLYIPIIILLILKWMFS